MTRALLKQALDALENTREALILMRKTAQSYGEAWAAAYVKEYRDLSAGSAKEKFELLALMDERLRIVHESIVNSYGAIAALQAALAQPEPESEPIGYVVRQDDGDYDGSVIRRGDFYASHGMPCYTRLPAEREPLTDGEIYTAYITATNQTLRPQDERLALAFACAIEAAHGIRPAPEVRRARPDDTEGGEV